MNNSSMSSHTSRPQSSVSLDGGMLDWFASSTSFNVSPPTPSAALVSSPSVLPIRSVPESLLLPFSFYVDVVGRNIRLSDDGIVAVRLVEDYCNAYVFSRRPFRPSETLVIQVLSVDLAYTGGLAFGMTCCDPSILSAEVLPDDSDLLLDRPEYWIVNKDVCSNAEVADELAFYLTDEGRFG
jgi:protein neuralized